MERIDQIKRQIARLSDELDRLESLPDFSDIANGSVVAVTIADPRGRGFNCVGLKQDDRWSFTGNAPRDASDEDVSEWLSTAMSRGWKVVALAKIAELELVGIEVIDLGGLRP